MSSWAFCACVTRTFRTLMLALTFRRPDGIQAGPPPGGWDRPRGHARGREGPQGDPGFVRPLLRDDSLPRGRPVLPRHGSRVARWRIRVLQIGGRDPPRRGRSAGGDPSERRGRRRRRGLRPPIRTRPVRECASDEALSERAAQGPRRVQAGVGARQSRFRHRPGEHGGPLHAGSRVPLARRD